jgi:hypothetical protein
LGEGLESGREIGRRLIEDNGANFPLQCLKKKRAVGAGARGKAFKQKTTVSKTRLHERNKKGTCAGNRHDHEAFCEGGAKERGAGVANSGRPRITEESDGFAGAESL